MTKLAAKLRTLRDEKGATAVEYGLIDSILESRKASLPVA